MDFRTVLDRAREAPIGAEEAVFLFEESRTMEKTLDLFETASHVRDHTVGKTIRFDGFIGPISSCETDPPCRYCIRAMDFPEGGPVFEIYERGSLLSGKELELGIGAVRDTGVTSILLLGGTNPQGTDGIKEAVRIAGAVAPEVQVCVNAGPSFSEADLLDLKALGVSAVSSSFETMNRPLFEAFKPGDSLEKRIELGRSIGRLGFAYHSGILIGLGESYRDRVDHMIYLKSFENFEFFTVNWFHPMKYTPVQHLPRCSPMEAARTAAVARLLLWDVDIQVAIRPYIQLWLMAGCNRFSDLVYLWAYRDPDWPGTSTISSYLGELIFDVEAKGIEVEKVTDSLCLKNLLPVIVGYVEKAGLKVDPRILARYGGKPREA